MAKLTGKDKELADKMQALLLEYGYKSTRYFVSHDSSTARFTVNTSKVKSDGTVDSKYAQDFKVYGPMEGCELTWLGRQLKWGGSLATFEGLLVKRGKEAAAVLKRADGKFVAADLDSVKVMMRQAA